MKKAAADLEAQTSSVYLSEFQKVMATGIIQIMNTQDALMGTLCSLLEKEKQREELDEALQKDLTKICTGVSKRERNITVKSSMYLAVNKH